MTSNSTTYQPTSESLLANASSSEGQMRLYQAIFAAVVMFYCYFYAPYGINYTDGGFLTGLAWQVLSGKTLYADIIYVRPPLPVWLHTAHLWLLPDSSEILLERYIFYLKIAGYVWLASSLLTVGANRYILATLSFVVSVHCAPPAAWHTIDGVFFSVLAIFLFIQGKKTSSGFFSGLSVVAAVLCKQSFYPLWLVLLAFLWIVEKPRAFKVSAALGSVIGVGIWWAYLWQSGLWESYHAMTSASVGVSTAMQHGIFDYFELKGAFSPLTLVPFALLAAMLWFEKKDHPLLEFSVRTVWALWLFILVAYYQYAIIQKQEFTVPFFPIRALFLYAAAYFVWDLIQSGHQWRRELVPLAFLAVAWMAGISWGYNLPIYLSVPLVFAQMETARRLFNLRKPFFGTTFRLTGTLMTIILLVFTFRTAYEYVYHDTRRGDMHFPLASVSPKLSGLVTGSTQSAIFEDYMELATELGPNLVVLPNFTQAAYITGRRAILPLDWVVRREMGGQESLVQHAMIASKPMVLLQKSYRDAVFSDDPEFALVRELLQSYLPDGETPHFIRYKPKAVQ